MTDPVRHCVAARLRAARAAYIDALLTAKASDRPGVLVALARAQRALVVAEREVRDAEGAERDG